MDIRAFPKALEPGGAVGLVGPSGSIRSEGGLKRAVEAVKALGFRVKLGESCGKVYGYLSGTDDVRARDMNAMFADNEVGAIICLKGGYGTPRILDKLDYNIAREHPKLLMGYSDITAMSMAYYRFSGLPALHAPMPASCWTDKKFTEFSRRSMLRALTTSEPLGDIANPEGHEFVAISGGACEGIMLGGNLTLVAGLLGTRFSPDYEGKILLLEDIDERTYRLDHMFTQLRLAGVFDRCEGVVLGDFTDCKVEYPNFGLTLEQIISDIIAPCGKPVLAGLRAGHCESAVSLPLGVRYRLDANNKKLIALESMYA
jgi:muramoyltetrapeptide carboxypeptidase